MINNIYTLLCTLIGMTMGCIGIKLPWKLILRVLFSLSVGCILVVCLNCIMHLVLGYNVVDGVWQ